MKRLIAGLVLALGLTCALFPAQAQQVGGAFIPGFAYTIPGNWAFTGTNTHAGAETFSGTTTIAAPVLSGSVTGTYTLAGTPTLTSPTLTSATLNLPIIASESLTAAGATETLTSADCGQTQLLDTLAGSVVTLPAATGSGCRFLFLVTLTNTSNDHSIVVVGNDEFVGGLISIGTTADQTDAFTAAPAGGIDAIQMNGSTEGGLLGTWIIVQDIAADTWGLSGIVISTDASATMLVAGVVS